MKTKHLLLVGAVLCGLFTAVNNSFAQGTTFTYQGLLGNSNNLVTGSYDFTFKLFNALSGPAQVGPTVTNLSVGVTNGLFITSMDFGAQFNGTPYWLEIGVQPHGGGGFTTLTPREALTPTPYSITAENLDGFLSASQLTGTLPAGVLAGVNGGGLTSLNASSLTSGTVPDARLSPNVALLDHNQTFTGTNIFISDSGHGRVIMQGTGIIDTNLFTGLSLQYQQNTGESAIMSSFNDGYGFLSFYTKEGNGQPIAKQMIIDKYGNVAIDQGNSNNGVINNSTRAGAGLTFGIGSGEGIASKRTAGGNQYGLDFYTGFSNRMSILNSGFVGIGRQTPVTGADMFAVHSPSGTFGGMYIDTDTNGWPFYGYSQAGSEIAFTYVAGNDSNKWKLSVADQDRLTVTTSGAVGIGTTSPAAQLHVVKGGASGQSDTFGGGPAIFADTSTSDGIYSSTSVGAGYGVWGVSSGSGGIGVLGQAVGTNNPIGVEAEGTFAGNSVALSIAGGAIQVQGAGIGTGTPAFIQLSTAGNILGDQTIIDNPLCNGNPNAILIVTHNYNPPNGTTFTFHNHPFGVYYNGSKWTVYNDDGTAMATNIAFNVLVIKP